MRLFWYATIVEIEHNWFANEIALKSSLLRRHYLEFYRHSLFGLSSHEQLRTNKNVMSLTTCAEKCEYSLFTHVALACKIELFRTRSNMQLRAS